MLYPQKHFTEKYVKASWHCPKKQVSMVKTIQHVISTQSSSLAEKPCCPFHLPSHRQPWTGKEKATNQFWSAPTTSPGHVIRFLADQIFLSDSGRGGVIIKYWVYVLLPHTAPEQLRKSGSSFLQGSPGTHTQRRESTILFPSSTARAHIKCILLFS